MQVTVQCPSCGASQAAEAANTPIIAACVHCGGAITLPASINARPPESYSYRPPRPSPPPPSRTLRNLAVIGGIVIAALAGAWIFGPRIDFYARYDNPPHAKNAPTENGVEPVAKENSGYELIDYVWSTSDHGQYSAEYQGRPTDIKATTQDEQGTLALHRKVFDTGTSHWEVSYVDYPGKAPEASFVLDRKTEIISDYNSGQPELKRAIETETLSGEKFPGRELRYRTIAGALRCYRIFLVRNRLYLLGAEIRDERKLHSVDRFFDAFHLVGEVPIDGWKSQYLPK